MLRGLHTIVAVKLHSQSVYSNNINKVAELALVPKTSPHSPQYSVRVFFALVLRLESSRLSREFAEFFTLRLLCIHKCQLHYWNHQSSSSEYRRGNN